MVSVCLLSDALSQHLPSYLGFSYLGRGVSLHGCSNKAQLLLLTLDEGYLLSRKNEGMEPKQKQYPLVDVSGDRSNVRCYKEQYCIGTWNVRFMKQGKLEVVKQEMARVNVDILGISELKWTEMGGFNLDDHYIYYCREESLIRNKVAITGNKRVQNAVLGCNLNTDRTTE